MGGLPSATQQDTRPTVNALLATKVTHLSPVRLSAAAEMPNVRKTKPAEIRIV